MVLDRLKAVTIRAGHDPALRSFLLNICEAGALLQLPPRLNDRPATEIIRLRLVDGQPRMLMKTYAPSRLLPDAIQRDFPEAGAGQSILRIFSGRFGLQWPAVYENISPVMADANPAATFGIPPGSPLLRQTKSALTLTPTPTPTRPRTRPPKLTLSLFGPKRCCHQKSGPLGR